jgi:hypothetical protein
MISLLEQRAIVAEALQQHVFTLDNADGDPVEIDVDVVQVGYRPIEVIGEDVTLNKPRMTVVGMAYNDAPAGRNTKARTLYIRCFMERVVDHTAYSGVVLDVDNMLRLTDQMGNVCSGLNNWVGTNTAVDESNLPYMFHVLREKSFFQAILHPSYLAHLDRGRRTP